MLAVEKEKILNIPPATDEEIKEAMQHAIRQTESCLPEFSDTFKSSVADDKGFYHEAKNEQWTNGFWTGELWLAYENTGDERFKKAAMGQVESFLRRIEENIETDTHDLGFLYSLSCVAAYKLTGDKKARKAAMMAADKLLSRFQEKGQFIQAWGALDDTSEYRLLINSLANLPLLFWASEESGDERYEKAARAHLETTLRVVVRHDYSTHHTYYFDPETGAPLYGETHQGYSDDSSWARGQAWGIYGLAIAYRYTKDPDYMKMFFNVTEYFLEHLPHDLIPHWDLIFRGGSTEPRDSSSSAITVCGMLEMAKYVDKEQAETLKSFARRLMHMLIEKCAVTDPEESNGQLKHGVYSCKSPFNNTPDRGVDTCNLWGDYYYVEALTRLSGDWEPYW